MLQERFQLSRERVEFYYSIGLLILIPALIVANTLLLSTAVRGNLDTELRRKAALANSLITESIRPNLSSSNALQKQISSWTANDDELLQITVILLDDSRTTMIGANSNKPKTAAVSDLLLQTTISSKKSIAQELNLANGERAWRVVSPVSQNSATVAVVVTDVSSKQADSLIGTTLLRSLGIVAATVAFIVLLLLNHFKFVQYALLFRRMKEVDQLKNDFLSVATHELRAPMTVIKGSIENLEDGIAGTVDDKGRQTLQQIAAETDRLNNLVTDLLNVSRLEQGRISYNVAITDTREICQRIVSNFRAKAQEKGLDISYDSPESPELVSVDPGRMTEIMTNLIDNAIKYSRVGSVTVSHKSTSDQVVLSVRDTGIGMAAQDRERLFSRFYRVQNEDTKAIPGTGLGLWIIKQYVEAMHGSIHVDSMVDVGTEFVVTFPRVQSPANPTDR